MRLSTHRPVPVEYSIDDDRWPNARSIFYQVLDPYTTVALVLPLDVCDDSGVAHVLEHLLFRGSARFPDENLISTARQKLSCLDINASTHADHLVLHVTSAHQSDLIQVFDAYFDAIQQPIFDPSHFKEECQIVLNEINAPCKNPNCDGGLNIGGDPEWLEQLTYQSLQSFWQHRCHPSRFILIVVGAKPITFSYLSPPRAPMPGVPAYMPITAKKSVSKGVLLSLGTIRCASEHLDSLMVQLMAQSLGWFHRENLASFTLWHPERGAVNALLNQISNANEIPLFEQWINDVAQQTFFIGTPACHFTVSLANLLAGATIRRAKLENIVVQYEDIEAFHARWLNQDWRKSYVKTLGHTQPAISVSESPGNKWKPVPVSQSQKPVAPSSRGTWLNIKGVSVWAHENEDVHWLLQFADLRACDSAETQLPPHETLQLTSFNQTGSLVAQQQISNQFADSDTFIKALQNTLNPPAFFARLQSLPPAYVAVLDQGKFFNINNKFFSSIKNPTLQHLSIPKRFLGAFKRSGIENNSVQSLPSFNKVYHAVDHSEHHSGSAVILVPARHIPDAQQEAALHLFAAYFELKFIMPNLRESCSAYGGSARYLPHLNVLIIQSFGDPSPNDSLKLLLRLYDQLSSKTPTTVDLEIARNQAHSLLQLRGKSSLLYQLGEVVTASRWKRTQEVCEDLFNCKIIDVSTLMYSTINT